MVCIKWINLEQIKPIYEEHTSKQGMQRRLAILDSGQDLDLIMKVEKEPVSEKYILVAGYPEYKAYQLVRRKSVPCQVEDYSTPANQTFTQLKRIFTFQHGFWIDKHNLISRLLSLKISSSEIEYRLGLTTGVRNYLIDKNIPENIREKAIENEASFNTLNQISRMRLHPYVKSFLLEHAVLPKGRTERVSQDKLQKIKWFLKNTNDFGSIHYLSQVGLLKEVIHYKQGLLRLWQKRINETIRKDTGLLILNMDTEKGFSGHPRIPQ